MAIRFSAADVKKSKLVDPGWKKLKVVKFVEGTAKADGSTYWRVTVEVVEGPFAGVPIDAIFSEKYLAPFITFFNACGAKFDENSDTDIDENLAINRIVEGNIEHKENRGRLENNIADWRQPIR